MIRSDRHQTNDERPNTGLNFPAGDNPFTVPGGYFESLPSRVMERISAEQGSRTGRMFRTPLIKATAIAAGIALLAGISLLLVWSVQKERVAFSSNDRLTADELSAAYVIHDIDEYTLISAVAEQETMESLAEYSASMDSAFFADDIESYLLESNHIEYLIINSN